MTATVTPIAPATKGPKRAAGRPPRKSARRVKQKRRKSQGRPVPPIRWRTLPFAGFIAALLCSGLMALLLVNNSLAAGSFERARLKAERTLLFEQEQTLDQEVLALSSPGALRKEARRLGMVSAASTAFLAVSTGKILGVPKATALGEPAAGSEDSDAEADDEATTESAQSGIAGESDSESSTSDPESVGNGGDGARAGEDVSDGAEDQAIVTDPPETGDGAQVSSGTAQDRAIVSGGG